MAIPAGLVVGAGKVLANEVAMRGLQRATSDIWNRVFKPTPLPEATGVSNDRIAELLGKIPTDEEVAAAFAILEGRISQSERRIRALVIAFGGAQILLMLILVLRG
ncbi:MAG: hypothetical protein JWM38_1445 [Sphingomonas bacterium]|jgi:hypothetical protein|nr:hypothetical protein [Sphingomonas bacterium]